MASLACWRSVGILSSTQSGGAEAALPRAYDCLSRWKAALAAFGQSKSSSLRQTELLPPPISQVLPCLQGQQQRLPAAPGSATVAAAGACDAAYRHVRSSIPASRRAVGWSAVACGPAWSCRTCGWLLVSRGWPDPFLAARRNLARAARGNDRHGEQWPDHNQLQENPWHQQGPEESQQRLHQRCRQPPGVQPFSQLGLRQPQHQQVKADDSDLEQQPQRAEGASVEDRELSEARSYALRLVTARMMTEAVLQKKLIARGVREDLIPGVLQFVQQIGLQNDKTYAEAYASSKFCGSSWGPARIRMELRRKGIKEKLIENAIQQTFNDEELGSFTTTNSMATATATTMGSRSMEQHAMHSNLDGINHGGKDTPPVEGMQSWIKQTPKEFEGVGKVPVGFSSDAWHRLRIDAKKAWTCTFRASDVVGSKRRFVGWLQRRGYSWTVISALLSEVAVVENHEVE